MLALIGKGKRTRDNPGYYTVIHDPIYLGPALMYSILLPYRVLPEFEVRALLVSIENLLAAPLLNN